MTKTSLSRIALNLEFCLIHVLYIIHKEMEELICSTIISLHPVCKLGHPRLGATAGIHHKFSRKLNEHSWDYSKTSEYSMNVQANT